MTVALGLAALAAILLWLYRRNEQDLEACASALGLQRAAPRTAERGTSVEGFSYTQSLRLEGTLLGRRAELWVRTVKHLPNRLRRRGSEMTVLVLDTGPTGGGSRFRLQPAGMMRLLEHLQQGAPAVMPTGDADFDRAYHLYTPERAVPAALDAGLRRALLDFRVQVAGTLGDNPASGMAAALLLGSFEVEPGVVRYVLFGSPVRGTASHLAQAAPLMARLAAPTDTAVS